MKKESYVVWGVVFVIVGVLLVLNVLGLTAVNILFPGWWTMLIIIPSCIGLYRDKDKAPSLICLIIGVILLLACLDIISFDTLWKLIIPVIIIIVGVKLMLTGVILKPGKEEKNVNRVSKKSEYISTFSSLFYEHGGVLDSSLVKAIFGSINVDYRNSEVIDSSTITINAIFGNARVLIPNNTKVIIKTSSVLGEINDNHKEKGKSDKTVYVYANAIFGSINLE